MSNRAYNRGSRAISEQLDREAQDRRITARRRVVPVVRCSRCNLIGILDQQEGGRCIKCGGVLVQKLEADLSPHGRLPR